MRDPDGNLITLASPPVRPIPQGMTARKAELRIEEEMRRPVEMGSERPIWETQGRNAQSLRRPPLVISA